MNAKETINKLIDSAIEVGLSDIPSYARAKDSIKFYKPCPHCGHETGYLINRRAYGWWKEFYDTEGNHYQTNNDGIYAADSTIVRCDTCNKVRRDVFYYDGKVIPW